MWRLTGPMPRAGVNSRTCSINALEMFVEVDEGCVPFMVLLGY